LIKHTVIRNFRILFVSIKDKNYRESESYVSHHPTGEHQSTRLSSVPNINSQAGSSINQGWKPPYHIRKQKTERNRHKSASGCERVLLANHATRNLAISDKKKKAEKTD